MFPFTPGELAGMQATQESVMQQRALFTPWRPTQDEASGQMLNAAEPEGTVRCGVNFSAKGIVVDGTEGTIVAHYMVRLPLDMAARARPLCRYEVIETYGGELARTPTVLEQVSEPAIGPSGVVVWARNVE